jgi:hypothetical protein
MMMYPNMTECKANDQVVAAIGLPPPAFFAGREIYDFTAAFISPGSGLEKTVFVVDDPESEAGRAVRIDADGSSHFNLPYTIGLYDRAGGKTVMKKSFPKPLSEKGYAWYCIGKSTLPSDSYIWLTGTWQTSLRFWKNRELHGRTFEMYVSAKFTGRKYQKGSNEPSRIWIDRVVLAVPENEEERK